MTHQNSDVEGRGKGGKAVPRRLRAAIVTAERRGGKRDFPLWNSNYSVTNGAGECESCRESHGVGSSTLCLTA